MTHAMAPLQQIVGQDLKDHLRKKTVEEELQTSLFPLQAAKDAIETERLRRAKDDAVDAANDATASAAGQPEPDMASRLAKTAADDLMAAQLLKAYEKLKQGRFDLLEELQTLQPKEGQIYGLEELKQRKKHNRNLRALALKRLSTDPDLDASSTNYATELNAYKADKRQASTEIQVLQAEEDKIDLQIEEQSTHFDPADVYGRPRRQRSRQV
jgi:hypothetical protein